MFGGGSSSTASTTNQQVGAEGNSGPTFGAITVSKNTASTKTTKAGKAPKAPKGSAAQAPSADSGDVASAGNLSITTTTSDAQADQNLATTAQGSILAQNQLASAALDEQNQLALATLATASGIAGSSFQLAESSQASSAQNSSDVAQAGENLAAIGIGTQQASALISPTGGAATQTNSKATNLLLLASIAVTVILIFKKP